MLFGGIQQLREPNCNQLWPKCGRSADPLPPVLVYIVILNAPFSKSWFFSCSNIDFYICSHKDILRKLCALSISKEVLALIHLRRIFLAIFAPWLSALNSELLVQGDEIFCLFERKIIKFTKKVIIYFFVIFFIIFFVLQFPFFIRFLMLTSFIIF